MTNKIYFGDNLQILRDFPTESVDLIYIDLHSTQVKFKDVLR